MQKAKENNLRFAKNIGEEDVIMVDLLRRSKQFKLALDHCENALKENHKGKFLKILNFQRILISKSDNACHTCDEANAFSANLTIAPDNVSDS